MESEDEEDTLLVDASERVVRQVLDQVDGAHTANQIARGLQRIGGFDQKIHRYAMKLINNLLTVGLLRSAADDSAPRG